jgi:hypothetical protein
VVSARLWRRWSLSGREGMCSSLPPAELARRDSGVFKELKRLFPLRWKSERKRRRTEITEVIERWTGRVRSVFSVCACFCFWSDAVARLVTIDRTHSVDQGATGLQPDAGTMASGQFYSTFGHSFVERCSGLTSASGPLRDRRVRSIPACPVHATSASGRCFVT